MSGFSVIERNDFCAHSENQLLPMIFDERRPIRELASRKVLKARQIVSTGKSEQNFITQTLNFQPAE